MSGKGVWLRGGGWEKSGGAHKFSLSPPPPSKYNLSKLEWKVGKIFGQNCPHLFYRFWPFFFFLTFPFSGNAGFLFFVFFFFFLSLVLSGRGGFFFFSFFFIFLRKHFWMISYAIFWNVQFHLYTIFFFKV